MTVYFARVGDFIKVGFSTNPVNRVQRIKSDDCAKPLDLDRSSPVELLRVVPGDVEHEQMAHDALSDFRVCGEWFVAEPALLEYVGSLNGEQYPRLFRTGGSYAHVVDKAGQGRADEYVEHLLDRYRRRRAAHLNVARDDPRRRRRRSVA